MSRCLNPFKPTLVGKHGCYMLLIQELVAQLLLGLGDDLVLKAGFRAAKS